MKEMEKATKFFKSIAFLFGVPIKENYQKDLQSHSCKLPLGTMSSSSCAAPTPTPAMSVSVGNQFVHLGFFAPRNCIVYSIDKNIVSWETNDNPSSLVYGKSLLKSFELREVRPFKGKEWVLP